MGQWVILPAQPSIRAVFHPKVVNTIVCHCMHYFADIYVPAPAGVEIQNWLFFSKLVLWVGHGNLANLQTCPDKIANVRYPIFSSLCKARSCLWKGGALLTAQNPLSYVFGLRTLNISQIIWRLEFPQRSLGVTCGLKWNALFQAAGREFLLKGNHAFADLRYGEEDRNSPSTLIVIQEPG